MFNVQQVNCIGLKCPMPILQSRLALNSSKKGDLFLIYADDAGFVNDFKTFAFQADLKILHHEEFEQGISLFIVKVKK